MTREERDRLAASFDRIFRDAESYSFEASRSARGRDASGTVEALVEDSRLIVRVANGWERRLRADELEGAIAEARAQADEQRFSPAALRSGETDEVRPARLGELVDPAGLGARSDFLSLMRSDDFEDRLDRLIATVRGRVTELQSARGPQGIAAVTVSFSGEILRIDIDADAAAGRPAAAVENDIQSAIDSAIGAVEPLNRDGSVLSAGSVIELLSEQSNWQDEGGA